MAQWRQDDEQLVDLCFKYDWECGKVSKIVKDVE